MPEERVDTMPHGRLLVPIHADNVPWEGERTKGQGQAGWVIVEEAPIQGT
jgi:hypothetical protein